MPAIRAVRLTYFIQQKLRFADAVNEPSRAARGNWRIPKDALKTVLTLHDAQLQSIPLRRYETACARLLNYLMKGGQQVI